MKRVSMILTAVALLAVLMTVPGAAAATSHNETANSSTAPGEQLSGIVGVQSAELDGDIDNRTYGIKVARAQTDEAKADVVGEQLSEIKQQLADHEAELKRLKAEREAGNMSEGAYRAKVATVAAKKANSERAIEQANETTSKLPESVLSERGINVDAINELRANASKLGGPETSEIARSIAGESATTPGAGDRNPAAGDRTAPSDDRPGGNETTTDDKQDADTNTSDGSTDQRSGGSTDGSSSGSTDGSSGGSTDGSSGGQGSR